MLRAIIHIRALGSALVLLLAEGDVSRQPNPPSKTYSLIDQMLRTRLHPRLLHPQNRLVRGLARQVGVRAEALPVPTALRDTPDVHHRTELNINALRDVLLAHEEPAEADEAAVPGRGGVDGSGERGDEVGEADAEGGVLKADVRLR